MPEEKQNLTDDDVFGDPATDNANTDDKGGNGADDGQSGKADLVTDAVSEMDFGGLPFKDLKSFVDAHKNLQREYGRTASDLKKVRDQFEEVKPLLENLKAGHTKDEKKEIEQNFIEAFLKDPEATLSKLVDARMGERFKTDVDPIRATVQGFSIDRELKEFESKFGWLDDADQEKIADVVKENTYLHNLPNRLEIAAKMVIADDPEAYAAKRAAYKEKASSDLTAAKGAASGIGAKGAQNPKKGQPAKDEFDEILEYADSENKRFK